MNPIKLQFPPTATALGRFGLVCLLGVGLGLGCTSKPAEPDEPIEDEEDIPVDVGAPDTKDTGGFAGWDIGAEDVPSKKDTTKPPKDAGKVDAGTVDAGADAGDDPDAGDVEVADVVPISCTADDKLCDGNTAVVCNATGDGYKPDGEDCSPGVCQDGACKADQICVAKAEGCDGKAAYKCSDDGTEKVELFQCGKTEICKLVDFDNEKTAECVPVICVPSKETCSGDYDAAKHAFSGDLLVKCSSDGTVKKTTGKDCTADGKVCVVDTKGIATCALPSCGDGKVKADEPAEQCDLGSDAATGKNKNGVAGAKCDKDCQQVSAGCETSLDCAKLELGTCDLAWTCHPKYNECEAVPKLSGPCDDGNACTTDDTCLVGTCFGLDSSCDDGNPCTTDGCDPLKGCTNTELLGAACSDGQDCTVGDSCSSGTCKPGKNACSCVVDKDCVGYDDGDPCNGTLLCKSGNCVVADGTTVVCGQGVCISEAEKTEPACEKAGKKWFASGGKCLDPLTKSETKAEEACTAAKGVWQANNDCRKAECAASSGACQMKLAISGSVCSDGNACTKADQCWGGLCEGDPAPCDDKNTCTADTCHTTKGCIFVKVAGTGGSAKPCDDGDPCTNLGGLDKCEDGQCTGVNGCECKANADCADKNGGDLCVGVYLCNVGSGKCELDPAKTPYCDPKKGSDCAVHACDPKDGQCKTTLVKAGSPCNDGNACTTEDNCKIVVDKGVCVGTKNTCEDGEPCTTDSCDPNFGCANYANSNPCDDGNPCTTDDKCVDGKCWPGNNECTCFALNDPACDKYNSANPCQGTYKCNLAIKKCHFDPGSVVKCGGGYCSDAKKTNKPACLDSQGIWYPDNDCAYTSCNSKTGQCEPIKQKDGVSCSDGSPCTTPDLCADGKCETQPKACNDSNACTKDSCDPAKPTGCVFDAAAMDSQPCDDGDVCNAEGGCKSGTCEPGTGLKGCDDGNSCTADGCDAKLGCYNLPLANENCDDGDYCTGWGTGVAVQPPKGKAGHNPDLCNKLGGCVAGDKITCDDGGACTKETCNPGGWVADLPGAVSQSCEFVYLGKEATCVSADKCTENDFCEGGTCSGVGTKVDCDDGNVCTNDSCDPQAGCQFAENESKCDDGNACTIEDACIKKACFTQKTLNCDDENLCTKDTCDPKTGCKHEVDPLASSCGDFAVCSKGDNPKCEFAGIQHLMISEIYVGDPDDMSDDFVEIYNPSQKKPKLGDYVLQWRPKDSDKVNDWQLLAKLPAATLHDYGYLLVANSGPLPGGIKPDVTDALNFKLLAAGMQVRIFDLPHTLSHDVVTWGVGAGLVSPEGQALKPWFSARSMERRASKDSAFVTMVKGGSEWLAGNAVDSNNNTGDFIERMTPEPQALTLGAIYEPSCKSKCPSNQTCDYKGAGKDACVLDGPCSIGCGSGKKCQAGFGICVPDFKDKVLISELLMGATDAPGAEFIELYNAGATDIDITGFTIEIKGAAAGGPDPWVYVTQLPAKTVLKPKRFYLIATQSWAKMRGGVDAVLKDASLGLDPVGGALRLWDPRTAVELDKVGWGTTKEYEKGAFKQGVMAPGSALIRKAKPSSTGLSMAPGGADHLAGHAVDTDVPDDDFVLAAKPEPWSNRSGAFAPACGGTCPIPGVCNFEGKGACVDPTCGGACKSGSVCNINTGKCDLTLLISQYSVYGPAAKAKQGLGYVDLAPSKNEWIEVFNPGYAAASIEGMVIQAQYTGVCGWKTRSHIFTDKCISDATKKTCAGPQETCHCIQDLERNNDGSYKLDNTGSPTKRQCVFDDHCQAAIVSPRGYLLIAASIWDVQLPQPQWWAKQDWGFDPNNGGLRLVRSDGAKFPLNKQEADKVGWGYTGCSGFCKTVMPKPDTAKPHCTFMRKPWPEATAEQMGDPLHPAYYGGSALKTDGMDGGPDCQTDLVLVCPRRPRNALQPPQNL